MREKLDFQVYHRRKERGRQMLRQGKYDDVSLVGWGHPDDLIAMVMGIYKVLEKIKTGMKGACYIPRWVICNALFFKLLPGEDSYLPSTSSGHRLVALWRFGRGERYVGLGIRRLRRQALTKPDQVIVYVGWSYDIMSLAEFVAYLGRPPTGKLNDVVKILAPSRRYAFSLHGDESKRSCQ